MNNKHEKTTQYLTTYNFINNIIQMKTSDILIFYILLNTIINKKNIKFV